MWGKISAAAGRIKWASSNIGSAGARPVSAAADLVKKAPEAVRNLRQNWAEKPKSPDFLITPIHLPRASRSKARVYLISIGLTFLVASLVTALGVWITDQFSHANIAGMLLSPVLVMAVGAVAYALWRELRSWRRLIAVKKIRADLASATSHPEFRSALKRLGSAVDDPHRGRIADLLGRMDATWSIGDLRDALDQGVVHHMDSYAVGAIHRATRDMFFLSLVSPTDLTDTIAFVARAAGMIRGVTFAYGQRPGRLGLIRLVRHVVADVALLSVTMIVVARGTKGLIQVDAFVFSHVMPVYGRQELLNTCALPLWFGLIRHLRDHFRRVTALLVPADQRALFFVRYRIHAMEVPFLVFGWRKPVSPAVRATIPAG